MLIMPETNPHKVRMHLWEISKDYWAIATRRQFLRFAIPYCLLFMGLICWIVESPFIIVQTYHQTPIYYGVLQLLVFGAFMVGAQVAHFAVNQIEPLKMIKIGLSIAFIAGLGLIAICFTERQLLHSFTFMMMVLAFGFAVAFGPMNRYAIESCTEPMGRRMAIFSTYMSLFGVAGTIVVTLFNDKSVENLAILVAISIFVAMSCYWLTDKKNPSPTKFWG
jgi:hypothetical protein